MISHHRGPGRAVSLGSKYLQKTVVIGKIGIRTCFQFFLLITRILKGALFYHGHEYAGKIKWTLGTEKV
jgi:hypothetical protein